MPGVPGLMKTSAICDLRKFPETEIGELFRLWPLAVAAESGGRVKSSIRLATLQAVEQRAASLTRAAECVGVSIVLQAACCICWTEHRRRLHGCWQLAQLAGWPAVAS